MEQKCVLVCVDSHIHTCNDVIISKCNGMLVLFNVPLYTNRETNTVAFDSKYKYKLLKMRACAI